MDPYLSDQMERMGRATTLADIRRIEERLSRTPRDQAQPAPRHRAGWPLGFLAARRRRTARPAV